LILKVPRIDLLLLANCSLSFDKSDIAFEPFDVAANQAFVDAVGMGHFGRTSLFASRIVVQMPLASLVFVQRNAPQVYALWSLEAGMVVLRMKDDSRNFFLRIARAVQATADRMPPADYLFRIRSLHDLHVMWRSGRLSAFDYILRLNGFRGRLFVDMDKYPVVPGEGSESPSFPTAMEVAEMIGQVSHVKMFLPRTGRNAIPAVNSVAVRQRLELGAGKVSEWAKALFGENCQREARVKISHIANIDGIHSCQQLSVCPGSSAIFYDNDSVVVVPEHGCELPCAENIAVTYRADQMALTILNYKTGAVLAQKVDPLFAFANHVAVSENGLFFAVDLTVGFAIVYQIDYGAKFDFHKLSMFSCSGVPQTIVSESDLVCVTACDDAVTVWNIRTGGTHRTIRMDAEVAALSFDPCYSYFMVATSQGGFCLDVNGNFLCQKLFEGVSIVTLTVFPLPASEIRRCAICGTADGKIWLASPRFDLGSIELKRLNSGHRAAIRDFVVHRSKRTFLSVDLHGIVYSWTAQGLLAPRMKPSLFLRCLTCNGRVRKCCRNCNRAFCERCLLQEIHGYKCILCNSVELSKL
jgi:hypothetical protein